VWFAYVMLTGDAQCLKYDGSIFPLFPADRDLRHSSRWIAISAHLPPFIPSPSSRPPSCRAGVRPRGAGPISSRPVLFLFPPRFHRLESR